MPGRFVHRSFDERNNHATSASLVSREKRSACFVVRDHSGQALAYCGFRDEPDRVNVAKLPDLLRKT
jgi:hypothetical protein